MKEVSSTDNTNDNITTEKEIEKPKKEQKSRLVIFLIITIIALIVIIGFILIYFLFIKNDKKKEATIITYENSLEATYHNSIEATYDIKSGKEMSFLNPYDIALKNEDYTIEEINFSSEGKNNLRLLKVISVNDGKFIPTNSGILSAKINFKNNLNSINGLFKDNEEIIKVKFSNFNMSGITSMKSTFSGCSNLTEVNFDGINTSKLIDMGKTFENCTELKKLDLSPIDTTNLVNMGNLFSGCNKLETINLSSFNNINNDIFNGIKSKPDIIANDLISNDISKIFKDLFSINI